MADQELIVLRETGGRVYAFSRSGGERRIRGVGRIDPDREIGDLKIGDSIKIGTKSFIFFQSCNLPIKLFKVLQRRFFEQE